ncbi:MAG: hypothetical protein HY903_07180 [Deltaproteobacteria bacterium]|nr:hypothetical protein [Deltaproteobacteria bacterium]
MVLRSLALLCTGALVAAACSGGDEKKNTYYVTTSQPTAAACGNGRLDLGERCDGSLLDQQSCTTLGLGSGTLGCSAACDAFDTVGCANGCVPDCSGRECGPDPVCGVACGRCASGTCDDGTCSSTCVPDCGQQQCGLDPICGVSCGSCGQGVCDPDLGQCVTACVPDCSDQECGPDPVCGVSCGSCAQSACGSDGWCTCVRDCRGRLCGPDPVCGESCGSCTSGTCDASGRCSGAPADGLVVGVTWNTAADLDLHMRQSDDAYCTATSCYYQNCGAAVVDGHPDWDGVAGVTSGDPLLAIDDLDGYGPEQIRIVAPVSGQYTVAVHYYGGNTTPPTTATVKIWVRGALVFQQWRDLTTAGLWEAAAIGWNGTTAAVVPGDALTPSWSCEAPAAAGCQSDADCSAAPWPDTEYCDLQLGYSGECRLGCRRSGDCAVNQVCDGSHTCVLDSASLSGWMEPCAASGDCRSGLYCNPMFNTCSEACLPPTHECAGDPGCCPQTGAARCVDLLDMGFFAYCTNDLL